jgi:transposase
MVRPCCCPASDESGKGRQNKEHAMSQNLSSAVAVIGIDIGKNSLHVVGLDDRGAIVLRQKWSRGQIEARLANMPRCLIGVEACVGAHHLSRKLQALGHDALLMPAKYVRPYSKGQKNDFRDAEAIAEAVQRPTMKFVATKTADQLDLQALHRVRERLVSQRTGIINQIRAFLLERGMPVRQGLRFLRAELPRIFATSPDVLSPRMMRVIRDLAEDWRRLDERVDYLSSEICGVARQDAGCERLMSVPGIGPIISSAMVAAIGTGDAFAKGRDFAAWLGLVPKQISTGDRTILGKISKRGNRYLRVLFVQAAWVVLIKPMSWERHGLKHWIEAARKRLHRNVLAIALANKLARIAWGVLAGGRTFEPSKLRAA